MSPSSSTRNRKPVAKLRETREVVTAVLVGVGIVLATLVLIWLLRPGKRGVPGTGGLMVRQPRASLLVVLAAGALVWMVLWLLRGYRRPRRWPPARTIPVGVVLVVAGAVAAGILWPGGLVRHWPGRPDLSDIESPDTTVPETPTSGATNTSTPNPTTGASPTSTPGSTPPTSTG
jgi:hypothetical protein